MRALASEASRMSSRPRIYKLADARVLDAIAGLARHARELWPVLDLLVPACWNSPVGPDRRCATRESRTSSVERLGRWSSRFPDSGGDRGLVPGPV